MVDILSGVGSLPELLFSIFISAVLLAIFVSIFVSILASCIFLMYVIFEKLRDLYDYIKRKFNEK